jgi:hypothetical protein
MIDLFSKLRAWKSARDWPVDGLDLGFSPRSSDLLTPGRCPGKARLFWVALSRVWRQVGASFWEETRGPAHRQRREAQGDRSAARRGGVGDSACTRLESRADVPDRIGLAGLFLWCALVLITALQVGWRVMSVEVKRNRCPGNFCVALCFPRPLKLFALRRALWRAGEARICPDHSPDSEVSELLGGLLNARACRDQLVGIETFALAPEPGKSLRVESSPSGASAQNDRSVS